MHPQNKMLGSDPLYFHFIFIFFISKGASAPSFYLGTPMGGVFCFKYKCDVFRIDQPISQFLVFEKV